MLLTVDSASSDSVTLLVVQWMLPLPPGQQCWVLYVDVLVLEWSGSVLDALSLAVRAALHTTRIPRLTVTGEGEEMEVEVSDNPHDASTVDVTNAPIIITLTQVRSRWTQLGQYYIKCSTQFAPTCGHIC